MTALATVGGISAVSLLLLLAPVSSAQVITKPFRGFTSSVSAGFTKGGCATAKILKPPVWSKKSGVFKSAGKANAPACRSSPGNNFADAYASVSVMGNLAFKTSGNHTVTVVWKISSATSWNVTPFAGCTFTSTVIFQACISEAEVQFFGYIFISNMNNSTWGTYGYGYAIGGFTSIFNDTYSELSNSGNFTGGSNGSLAATTWLNSSLNLSGASAVNKSDKFQIQIYLEEFSYAAAFAANGAKGTGKPSANSIVDIGTLGHGALLQGILIS